MRMALPERLFVNSFLWDWYLRYRLRGFLTRIPGLPRRTLEVGCGKGTTTRLLAEAFPRSRILAVDIDPAEIVLARRTLPARLRSRIAYRVANATRLPGRFDSVAEFHALHHIGGWRAMLQALLARVKPGGRFLCIDLGFPARLAWLWRTVPGFRPYFPCGPSFTRDALLAELRRKGFRIEYLERRREFAVIARRGRR